MSVKRVKRLPFRGRRKASAGIVAAVILFAMIFTVGTSYFISINNTNLLYLKSLTTKTQGTQNAGYESLTVTAVVQTNNIKFYANNTGSLPVNITAAYVLDSSGNVLKCLGVGIPVGSACYFSTTALSTVVNVGKGSSMIDTGYTYVSGTDTVKLLTARGNIFSASYPEILPDYALQAQSSGALTVDLSTFKWLKPTGDTQSGQNVGGYVATALKKSQNVVFKISFTNRDPQGRSVTLWPGSTLTIVTIKLGSDDARVSSFYIIDGVNTPFTTMTKYNTTQNYLNILKDQTATLYFGARDPLNNNFNTVSDANEAPFMALFSLTGQYSDKTLYAQTIPFPAGVVSEAQASLSAYSGGNGALITLSCPSGCKLFTNRIGFVGWIDSTGAVTTLKTFTTDASGDVSTTFNIPTASAGYYTVIISDYWHAVPFTFNHT